MVQRLKDVTGIRAISITCTAIPGMLAHQFTATGKLLLPATPTQPYTPARQRNGQWPRPPIPDPFYQESHAFSDTPQKTSPI